MSVEIAWKQNILVTDFLLLKSMLVVLGFGSQAFVCGFSRQNINSVFYRFLLLGNTVSLDDFDLVGIQGKAKIQVDKWFPETMVLFIT